MESSFSSVVSISIGYLAPSCFLRNSFTDFFHHYTVEKVSTHRYISRLDADSLRTRKCHRIVALFEIVDCALNIG